jgi:hypothetical protein
VPHRRTRLFAFAAFTAVVLGGCRVDATVEARVAEAGGTVSLRVRLDREAVALLGGAVADGAQTSDLRRTGWEVSPVKQTKDGGAEVEVSKAFHRPADFGVVIGELAGPGGPLQGFSLERHHSFLSSTYRVRGTADLGPGAVAATGLANVSDFAGRFRDAGVDPDRVQQLLAGRAAEDLHLRLVLALPGRTRSWALQPGAPVAVDVSSSVIDWARPTLLALAAISAAAVLARLRRRATLGSSTCLP